MKYPNSLLVAIICFLTWSCKKNDGVSNTKATFTAYMDGTLWVADSVVANRIRIGNDQIARFQIVAKKNDGSCITLYAQSAISSNAAATNSAISVNTASPSSTTLLSFSDSLDVMTNTNFLKWSVSNETNLKYQVQRSYDATTFQIIGEVNAIGQGTDQTYLYSDVNPPLTSPFNTPIYYRLLIVANNNSTSYSATVVINIGSNTMYLLSPTSYSIGYNGSTSVSSFIDNANQNSIINGTFSFTFTDNQTKKHVQVTDGVFRNVPVLQ